MAKKSMNLKYKSPKRERKNRDVEEEKENYIKSTIKSICGVIIFFGCAYLIVLGMEKLGVFEAGYTAPDKEEAQVSYEYISTGMVFNRPEKTYYVIFDDYTDSFTYDIYVEGLLKDQKDYRVYKVDMSKDGNGKVKSEESNPNPTNSNELKIKGVTLIKITNGKVAKYLEGNEAIEGYFGR